MLFLLFQTAFKINKDDKLIISGGLYRGPVLQGYRKITAQHWRITQPLSSLTIASQLTETTIYYSICIT